MKKVALHTLGCKLNFTETATLGRQFQEHGYRVVSIAEPADVVVLNTCSVTERADRECRQLIRRARRTSPQATIVVTGCYAQLRPEEIAAIPGVDLVLGTKEKAHLVDRLGASGRVSAPTIAVSARESLAEETVLASSTGFADRTRAFLKIQDGCDYQCSFCTIPMARGESRSIPLAEVLDEAHRIADAGYREIVLTGVNVGDYGRKEGARLLDLLRALAGMRIVERIRVSSIEPNLLDDDLLDFWLSEPVMCKHFHIPLQSGSNQVLRLMRRRYQQAHYRDRIERILKAAPGAGIGADIMVGFPGETDKLFEETALFLADLPIAYLHVFPYSERPGTDATEFGDPVEPRIRTRRAESLRLVGERKRTVFHESHVGRVVPVLVEAIAEGGSRTGLTDTYVRVEFDDDEVRPNEIVDVVITGADAHRCTGFVAQKGSQRVAYRPFERVEGAEIR